jgi:hypothetical protein
MKYFEQIDIWLTSLLEELMEEPSDSALLRVKKDIKDKILESYHNGQDAGPRPTKDGAAAEEKRDAAERPRSRSGYPKRGSTPYYRKPSGE